MEVPAAPVGDSLFLGLAMEAVILVSVVPGDNMKHYKAKVLTYLASVFLNFEWTASPACSHTMARPLPSLVSWVSRWQHIMWIFHVMFTLIFKTSCQ